MNKLLKLVVVITLSLVSLSANADYTFSLLSTFGGSYSTASSINSSGQVVGYSSQYGITRATLWSNETITYLGAIGSPYNSASSSAAYSINSSGQIVGYSSTRFSSHATLWSNGTITDLGTLTGDYYSAATAINSSGQVVGNSHPKFGSNRAVLWSNGTAIDLNSLLNPSDAAAGWILTDANAINDDGWIVGNASNSLLGISSQAFLLSTVAAVPELNTNLMLLMGLGVFGFIARRKVL